MSIASEWQELIYQRDPAAWIDRYVQKNELAKPFALYPHQRQILAEAFKFDADGVLPWDTIVWSCVKKSGKTTMLGILSLWWAMTQEPPSEVVLIANDLEQNLSRAFATVVKILRSNPDIDPNAYIARQSIELSNGTVIKAIASEYSGAAGSNHGLTAWDELWGYTSERSQRLFEELTPVPTRVNSIRLITTYAGFESESELLRSIYLQVVNKDEHPEGQGERIHAELPVYGNRDSRLFGYWDHEQGRFPWQTSGYYASQKRSLRASAYLRFHLNAWSNSSEAFITSEMWDACVSREHRPLLPNRDIPLFVGCDASLKHDSSAIVAVGFCEVDGHEVVALAQHQLWFPSPDAPLDLEATLEVYLLELHRQYHIQRIFVDPWQMATSIGRLRKAGLNIEAFQQTSGNLTRLGSTLLDLLTGRNLLLYPNAELRIQALSTIASEHSRGWKISKETASRKIDAIIALGMAAVGAVEAQRHNRWLPVGL